LAITLSFQKESRRQTRSSADLWESPDSRPAGYARADGSKRVYFYAWRGGPMLKDEKGEPLQETDPRFFVAYTDAHR
jgi:hypothetical protein